MNSYTDHGIETLRRMRLAKNYNHWLFDEIRPFFKNTLLEVGCGVGNMTDYFQNATSVVALDLLDECVSEVSKGYPNVQAVTGDITDLNIVERLGENKFDAVACLNVLEHIKEDRIAVEHMFKLLSPGGYLLLFVPAGSYLFGSLDRHVGHFRRYDAASLKSVVAAAGFDIVRLGYTNLAGIPGWWLNARVLKREILSINQLNIFDAIFPLFSAGEKCFRRVWDIPLGQSLICIGKRPLDG